MKKSLFEYLMRTAFLAAENSTYNGTHVGCVIATQKAHIVSAGWNGFPPGADDKYLNEELSREERLPYVIHAETNALINASRQGASVRGCVAFVTHHPCSACYVKLAAAGISEIYYRIDSEFEDRWSFDVEPLGPNRPTLVGFGFEP